VIAYTSGTSAAPKAVCLSITTWSPTRCKTATGTRSFSTVARCFLSVIPLLHSYGMTSAMNVPIALGGQMICCGAGCGPDSAHHPPVPSDCVSGVPSLYTAINNHAENVRAYGLAAIKACMSGSAPLPVEVQEEFEKLTRGAAGGRVMA